MKATYSNKMKVIRATENKFHAGTEQVHLTEIQTATNILQKL
jgi:hypothetical protein